MDDDEELSAEEVASMRVYKTWGGRVAHLGVYDGGGRKITEGSAFIWDDKGHMVTCAHVVQGGVRYECTFTSEAEKTSTQAFIIGEDRARDVAILRCSSAVSALPAQGARARVGQRVYVVGTPFGLSQSLSSGVVSGIGRVLSVSRCGSPPLEDLIQTDAALNRGCSGGPVLSRTGRLLGVATAIATPTGAFAGVGFCVPYATVARCVGSVVGAGRPVPLPALPLLMDGDLSLRVRGRALAIPTGAAAGTGLFSGDVLRYVCGVRVRDSMGVWRVLRRLGLDVGDEVSVVVGRMGVGDVELSVRLVDWHELCGLVGTRSKM